MSYAFDAYKFSKHLQSKGVPREDADLYAEAFNEALFSTVATHDQLEHVRLELSGKISALDVELSGKISALDVELSGKIDALDTKLSGRIDALDTRLSSRIDALDSKLRSLQWLFGLVYPAGLILLGLFLK